MATYDDQSGSRFRADAATRKAFGERVTHFRELKGYTQAELARRATEWLPKDSQKTMLRGLISKYEKGDVFPSPVYRAAIAKALGVTEYDILGGSPAETSMVSVEESTVYRGLGRLKVDAFLPVDEAWELAGKIRISHKKAMERDGAANKK
jgi:transcriptional regulator with XRE-family HTH domain